MYLFEICEICKCSHVLLNDLGPLPSVDLCIIQTQEAFKKSNNPPVVVKFSLKV